MTIAMLNAGDFFFLTVILTPKEKLLIYLGLVLRIIFGSGRNFFGCHWSLHYHLVCGITCLIEKLLLLINNGSTVAPWLLVVEKLILGNTNIKHTPAIYRDKSRLEM